MRREYNSNKHSYFEVGNGSRHTLRRVLEMMDTPPIQSDCAFYYLNLVFSDAYSYTGTVCSDGTEEKVELQQ